MMPIGPLMIEHRLIERMIEVIEREVKRIKTEGRTDASFIDRVVDFIRTYADRCHHGKEEGILFRELQKRNLDVTHKKIMDELIEEHKKGRQINGRLSEANAGYRRGDPSALGVILECLESLVDFYPKHIEKEDRRFFNPVMGYFTQEEKADMLMEGHEFDRELIHETYRTIVEASEKQAVAP